MLPNHFGAGKAHNLYYFLPHFLFIAVHRAFRANGLFIAESALINSLDRIFQKRRAAFAKPLAFVFSAAEYLQHFQDGFFIARDLIFKKHFSHVPI